MGEKSSLQTETSLNKEQVCYTLNLGFHFGTLMLLTGIWVKVPHVLKMNPFMVFWHGIFKCLTSFVLEEILADADTEDVALLVVGDPFGYVLFNATCMCKIVLKV